MADSEDDPYARAAAQLSSATPDPDQSGSVYARAAAQMGAAEDEAARLAAEALNAKPKKGKGGKGKKK